MLRYLHRHRIWRRSAMRSIALIVCVLVTAMALCGCQSSSSGAGSGSASGNGTFEIPAVVQTVFDESEASGDRGCLIDTAHVSEGYVTVSATSSSKLKFQMTNGSSSYNYTLSNDGTTTCFTLNMGDGDYVLRVMQNTEGSNYIELYATSASVSLSSEFAPYLCPGYYCDFDASSTCVAKAHELAGTADTQVQAVDAIYQWVISNISYDNDKAASMTSVGDYVPDPDTTLSSKKGICLDYACLFAAMLRSIGVPTKIVTGYVSADKIYHAWNMVYLNGKWITADFSVDANTWSRIDTTFAASGSSQYVGNGEMYVDHFTY